MRENLEPESNTALKEDTSLNQSDQTNTANTIFKCVCANVKYVLIPGSLECLILIGQS